MKTVLSISFLTLLSFVSFSQNEAELDLILTGIIEPMTSGDQEAFFERIVFPFEVGDKKYTKAQLKANYDGVFLKGTASCLSSTGSYQEALPDNDTWYLAICFSAPEGFEAAAYHFKKENGTWMLESIDYQ